MSVITYKTTRNPFTLMFKPVLQIVTASTLIVSSPLVLAQEEEPLLQSKTELPVSGLTAEQVVAQINAVDDGDHVTRTLKMVMTDKNGKVRERLTTGYRKYFGDEKRSVLFYQQPSNVKGTGFLTWDYKNPDTDDDQWLYLPALRKVRRISASDRGDYFLGTDMTYEDMKLEGKLEPADYHYILLGNVQLNSQSFLKLEGVPHTKAIARELGYGRTEFLVNPNNWVVHRVEFWTPKGKHLKSLTVSDIRKIDGIWTRHRMEMVNHKTGHKTLFEFSDVDYQAGVKDKWFRKNALKRGR